MPRMSGWLYMVSGAVLLSFSPVWVALVDVGPTATAFYRMAIGGVVLLAVARFRGEAVRAGGPALRVAAAAGFFLTFDLIFWHWSIVHVGPGLATILANFQVFVLAGFGVLILREHAGWRLAVAIPLALGGLVLLVGLDWSTLSGSYRLGVVLALLAALTYGTYLIFLRHSQVRAGRMAPVPNLAVICLVAAAMLAVATALEGQSFAVPDARNGLILLTYGLSVQVIGWLLISKGIARVPASRAGLLLLLQPSLAFVWDMLLFRRPTTAVELTGAAIALTAIYLGTTRR